MKPWVLQEITLKVTKGKNYEVAVLPVGSTEPHNFHIPHGSDAFQARLVAERICEKAYKKGAKVILLPEIPYGQNSNTFGFPLAMHMSPSTHLAILKDIVRSLENHNILKLVIFNSHGGNNFQPIARELYGLTKVFITVIDYWKVGNDVKKEIFEKEGEHGDEMETSVALELFPDLVHLEEADQGSVNPSRFEALNKGWAFIARPWHLLTKNSGYGDPGKASREKGKRYLKVIVDRLSQFIYELSEEPLDEKFPY